MGKEAKITWGFLILLLLSGSWILHEFYVSITELRYNPHTERVEVSIRVFPDDLDRALQEKHGIFTQLATELEAPEADSLLGIYLLQHVSLEIDGRRLKLGYLGKEAEADAIWCYLESDTLPEPLRYRIHNSLLTEQFEDQVNIVQVYQGDWNKGLMLNRDQRVGQLRVGD
jgi:hypothetical protein